MSTEDSRAQYLASGSSSPGAEDERLDLIRGVLAAEATWAEPPPHVSDGILASLPVEELSQPAADDARATRWPLALAGVGGLVAVVALVLGTISVTQGSDDNVVTMSGTELQAEAYREPPAHYFGVPAVAAGSAAALETAVRTALAANGPTVIEAVVDSDHYADTVYD